MKKYFDIRHGSVAVIETESPEDGMIEVGASQSTLAARYGVDDGVVVDRYPGLSDDEVLDRIAQAQKPAAAAPEERAITKLQFMSLFTDAELAGVYQAARSNVMVEVWLEKLKLAETMNLADARTQAGIDSLVAAGLLEAARGEAIKVGEAPA